MSQWKKIAPFAALTLSMALATAGCLSSAGATDEAADEPGVAAVLPGDQASPAPVADPEGDEHTARAEQRCFGGWDDFAFKLFTHPFFAFIGCGCGCGF